MTLLEDRAVGAITKETMALGADLNFARATLPLDQGTAPVRDAAYGDAV